MIGLAAVCGLQIAVILALILDRRLERQEVARERRDLLQRIQAPEYAAIEHYNDHVENDSPPAVNPDVDEDFWMSKDDLAEFEAREELAHGD